MSVADPQTVVGVAIVAVGIADRTTVADDDHADAVACRPHVRACHSIVTPLAYTPAARVCVEAVEVTVPVEVHDPAPTMRCWTSYLVCAVVSVGLWTQDRTSAVVASTADGGGGVSPDGGFGGARIVTVFDAGESTDDSAGVEVVARSRYWCDADGDGAACVHVVTFPTLASAVPSHTPAEACQTSTPVLYGELSVHVSVIDPAGVFTAVGAPGAAGVVARTWVEENPDAPALFDARTRHWYWWFADVVVSVYDDTLPSVAMRAHAPPSVDRCTSTDEYGSPVVECDVHVIVCDVSDTRATVAAVGAAGTP